MDQRSSRQNPSLGPALRKYLSKSRALPRRRALPKGNDSKTHTVPTAKRSLGLVDGGLLEPTRGTAHRATGHPPPPGVFRSAASWDVPVNRGLQGSGRQNSGKTDFSYM